MRLDIYLVKNSFVDTRNKAQELIKNQKVKVNNKTILKPSFDIGDEIENDLIEVDLDDSYVSRASLKLKNFLSEINIEIKDKICLDIGSSTGGFVEVLLENGAKEINAVDVGKNQLHSKLRDDKRVKVYEETDIREFNDNNKFEIVTCDVSFISLSHVLPSIDKLANDKIIILFKPQFEVGINVKRDKNGVVKDEKAIKKAIEEFLKEVYKFNWKLINKSQSKVKGKKGSVEEFFLFEK